MTDDAMSERVREAVAAGRDEMVDLLCELIRFPSVPGQEGPLQEYLLGRCGELRGEAAAVPLPADLPADPDYSGVQHGVPYEGRPNIVVRRPGAGGAGHSLILQSHVDVVPDGGWAEAYTPVVRDGAVWGRGAMDCKGQVATAFAALRALDRLAVGLAGDLEAQFVIEEEVGGNGALAMVLQGRRADAALILEGTRGQIHPSNRGAAWFRITVEGKTAHMGRAHEGVNAIEKMMDVCRLLRQYETRLVAESAGYPGFERYDRPVQVNLGMMTAGDWPATVAAHAVLEGGVGFLPNKAMRDVMRELEEFVRAGVDGWTRDHLRFEWPKLHNDSFETPFDHPSVVAFAESCRAAGLAPEVFGWNVSCDARLYAKRGGMPAFVFGPGDIADAHSAHEHIAIAEMVTAAEALVHYAIRWCSIRG